MAKVWKFYILVEVSCLHLHTIFIYPHYSMFQKSRKNFISVNQFTHDNQVFIEFHPTFSCVKDLQTRQLLLKGPSRFGLYPWPSSHDPFSKSLAALIGEKVSLDQWHHQLGHPTSPIVSQVIKFNKLPVVPSKFNSICSSCQQDKSHRLHFSLSPSISSRPLQLLFIDVWGSAPLKSVNSNRFYLSIVDDFSKYTWFYHLQLKSDVLATFLRFKLLVETYFGTKILSVQSDNGGEFRPLQTSLTATGVSYHLSCPHTHHQMGSIERKHRHIVETGLTLLATANVPLSFWDSAFETAVYLINRLLSKVTKKKSPFETLFNISPDYKLLKIFGCECWSFLRPYNSPKLAFRSQFCVFIGYSKNHLRYKGLHIPSGKFTLLDIWSSMNKFFLFQNLLPPHHQLLLSFLLLSPFPLSNLQPIISMTHAAPHKKIPTVLYQITHLNL
jgi:hypothetical protein